MSRNLKKIGLIFAAFLLILGSLPFMGLSTAKAATEYGNDKVTIGTLKNTAGIPASMAKSGSTFANDNVNADVTTFDSNVQLSDAITNGKVNMAVTDLVSYAAIVKNNSKWKIVGTLPGYYGLVANKKYKSIKSLKGKTVAVDKKDSSKQYLQTILKKNHMKLSSVKIKQVDADSTRVDSLKSGDIDAAVLTDPAISNAKGNGDKILNRQKQGADNGNVLIVNTDYSKKNASAMRSIVSAMNEQIKRINKTGNYMMANDVLRNFGLNDKSVTYLNNMDFKFKKMHKVKKSDFKKAFKYAKSQKLYKGKVNYKADTVKIEGVK